MNMQEYFERLNDGLDTIARIEADHEQWRKEEKKAITMMDDNQEYHLTDYEPCEHFYDGTHCPICGHFTSTRGGNYADELQQDYCPECGCEGGHRI